MHKKLNDMVLLTNTFLSKICHSVGLIGIQQSICALQELANQENNNNLYSVALSAHPAQDIFCKERGYTQPLFDIDEKSTSLLYGEQ